MERIKQIFLSDRNTLKLTRDINKYYENSEIRLNVKLLMANFIINHKITLGYNEEDTLGYLNNKFKDYVYSQIDDRQLKIKKTPLEPNWESSNVYVSNEKMRYGNKIPAFQVGMHVRNYDRSSDASGIHHDSKFNIIQDWYSKAPRDIDYKKEDWF